MPHHFHPSCEQLDRRELPASGVFATALGLYAIYASPPVAVARKIAFGGKIGKLAWTGQAKFAFGLVRISHPYPLRRVAIRFDSPRFKLRLTSVTSRRTNDAARPKDAQANPQKGPARDEHGQGLS